MKVSDTRTGEGRDGPVSMDVGTCHLLLGPENQVSLNPGLPPAWPLLRPLWTSLAGKGSTVPPTLPATGHLSPLVSAPRLGAALGGEQRA